MSAVHCYEAQKGMVIKMRESAFLLAYPEQKIIVERIVFLRHFSFTQGVQLTGEKRDSWTMIYIAQGEVRVTVENRGYSLRQGEAVIQKPNGFYDVLRRYE